MADSLTTMGLAGTALAAAAGAVVKALHSAGAQAAQIAELQRENRDLEAKVSKLQTDLATRVSADEFGAYSRMITELITRQTAEVGRLTGIAESIGK